MNPVNILEAKLKDGRPIIEATPTSNDVVGIQDLYLQLDTSSSVFDVIVDNISSGLILKYRIITFLPSYLMVIWYDQVDLLAQELAQLLLQPLPQRQLPQQHQHHPALFQHLEHLHQDHPLTKKLT